MSQTWPFDYFSTAVNATGVGDNTSQGVGAVTTPQVWPFDYIDPIVPVTGIGNNLSQGVGDVRAPQVWPFDYWDGVAHGAGIGDNLSQGAGAVTVEPGVWYPIDGSVDAITGIGNNLSQAGDSITWLAPVTGAGENLSQAGDLFTPESPLIAAGEYDLQLGRIRLPTLLDDLKESVGDQLEVIGGTVVPGERRARPIPLAIPVHKTGADARALGDRMRRQLRALLNNPAARLASLYLRFTPDPELSGWLLIDGGDLSYVDGGVSFSRYKLTLDNAYAAARQRSHLQARRIEISDKRLATTPRDTKGLIYESTWATNTVLPITWLPGAAGYQRRGLPMTGTPLPALTALMGTGTPNQMQSVADGDIILMTGPPDETLLQRAELGDVIVLDRQAQPATSISAARDLTPQASYGWEELYGPDQPISYPAGAPDIVIQNGACRVTLTPSTGAINVERITSSGFAPACTVTAMRGASNTALQIRDASIVEWTPDSAVVKLAQDNTQVSGLTEDPISAETYITLRRGWDAPRVETYLHSRGDYARLRVMPTTAGATTVRFSTSSSAAAITDGTDYGAFAGTITTKDPWALIQPLSGAAIIPAVCTGATKAVGRIIGSLRGLDFYDPAISNTSYQSVQLKVTTDLPVPTIAGLHGQASLLDVRTIPTFLPR